MTVAVVDFGTGNLRSVAKAIEHLAPKIQVRVTREPAQITAAQHVVLPGQGAIGQWMQELQNSALYDAVQFALTNRPVLGICLGMQALFESSAENGGTDGLALCPGRVQRFNSGDVEYKVPHMGWNTVRQTRNHPLWQGIENNARFYFVHSFYASGSPVEYVAGMTAYNVDFISAVAKDNYFAVQFHPEKSQHAGLKLIQNFLAWNGE